jgi:protein phosphatase
MQRMIAAGEITPDEAEVHPHRSVLLRALGTDARVDVDVQDVGLLEGDRLILCSDGLTTMITEEQVAAIAAATPEPQDAADRLIRAANRAGGIDNITVLVLDVVAGGGEGGSGPADPPRRSVGEGPTTDPPAWRGPAIRVGLAVVVVLVGLVGFRTWLGGRWYVGVAEGSVAIYQGIPAQVLGIDLSSVVQVYEELPAQEVTALPFYEDLEDGLNVASREEAEERVAQIERDLQDARRAERAGAAAA